MTGPYREKIFGVLVKIEPTSGTDASPTGTDAVACVGVPVLEYDYLESGDRSDLQNGVLIAPDRAAPAGRYGKIDITLEVKGSGTLGTPPEADALMRMAGCGRTVTAGVSVLYTTVDFANETGTIYCYSANKLFILTGAVAAFKMSADALKRGLMTFSVQGRMAVDPIEIGVPALTFSSVNPPLFVAAASSLGGWSSATSGEPMALKSTAIDFANTIVDHDSAGATDGLLGYLVTDRKATASYVVEVPALATFDAFSLSKAAGTSQPVSAFQIGTASTNRCKVTTGKVSLGAPKFSSQNGLMLMTLAGTLGAGAAGATAREIAFLYD